MVGFAPDVVEELGALVVGGVRVVVERGAMVDVLGTVVELGGVVELFDAFTSAATAITATIAIATARAARSPRALPRWACSGAAVTSGRGSPPVRP